MKLGILADIHERTEELRKAINVLEKYGAERFVVLGDVFECGERIDETVSLLRAAPRPWRTVAAMRLFPPSSHVAPAHLAPPKWCTVRPPLTAAGWIGFYWGKTPEELRRSKTIPDALTLGWLELFETKAKALEKQRP